MPTEQQPAVEPIIETKGDPYDLGDTELYPRREAEAQIKPVKEPAGQPTPVETPERPRNSDGTFAPRQPQHPDWLLAQARDVGFGDDDFAVMSTEAIGRAVNNVRRQTEALRGQFATQKTLQEAEVRRPAPTPPPEEDDLGVDLSEVHEPIALALKKLAKENKALREHIGGLNERENQREVLSSAEKIDAAFEALGPSYERFVGKGAARDFTEANKAEYRRRLAILQEAGITNLRQLPADLKKRLQVAAETLFAPAAAPVTAAAEPYAEAEKNGKSRVSPAEWAEAALQRPASRQGQPEPKGDALAIKNLERKLKERDQTQPDADVLDGLL